jgi:hypothetical protein
MRSRFRIPVSPELLAQLQPAGEFISTDSYHIHESRLSRAPYWTPKGLVLTEGRWTVSYWDETTQSRKLEILGRYRPNVISDPWVEELRAKDRTARARPKRKLARAKSSAKRKSKKGRKQ